MLTVSVSWPLIALHGGSGFQQTPGLTVALTHQVVTLSCEIKTSLSQGKVFWLHQPQLPSEHSRYQFLASWHSQKGTTYGEAVAKEKLTLFSNASGLFLNLTRVTPRDSGVYFCMTVGAPELTFRKGTRLNVGKNCAVDWPLLGAYSAAMPDSWVSQRARAGLARAGTCPCFPGGVSAAPTHLVAFYHSHLTWSQMSLKEKGAMLLMATGQCCRSGHTRPTWAGGWLGLSARNPKCTGKWILIALIHSAKAFLVSGGAGAPNVLRWVCGSSPHLKFRKKRSWTPSPALL